MADVSIQAGATHVRSVQGDLTRLEVDAIVNAANEWLHHGGGVAAAIAAAAGPVLQQESDAYVEACGPIATGTTAVTSGGKLPARWVIHTVGPRYREGHDNEGDLRAAVAAALVAGNVYGVRSMALPAISAGIFGYPRREAAAVIASEVVQWCTAHPDALDEVLLVGYDEETAEDFTAGLEAAAA